MNDIELPKDDAGKTPKRDMASGFLRKLLAKGPVPVAKVRVDAEDAGLSWATIRRAADELGVTSEKGGFEVGWSWRLPDDKPPGGERDL